MRFQRIIVLLAVLAVGFTGCITIEENYTFGKNGSGTMTYVVDMSEMGNMLSSLGGDEKEKDPGGDLGDMGLDERAAALRAITGISKVKMDNKQKWVQKLTFSFADATALNKALNQLMPDSMSTDHEFFKWENGALVRTSNRFAYNMSSAMASEAAADESDEEDDDSGFDMATMLTSMKYKYSFKFKKPVASAENSAMTREESGTKEVKLSTDWSVIAKDPKALDVRIQLAQ